jgi:excisionase family DNA binding protein
MKKSLRNLLKIMNDDSFVVGYCKLHERPIDQGTFEYKGCWTCWQHFHWENWPYIDVEEAVKQYGVSKSTIYQWIKRGKLKARLFTMGRTNLNVPKKFYAILPAQKVC